MVGSAGRCPAVWAVWVKTQSACAEIWLVICCPVLLSAATTPARIHGRDWAPVTAHPLLVAVAADWLARTAKNNNPMRFVVRVSNFMRPHVGTPGPRSPSCSPRTCTWASCLYTPPRLRSCGDAPPWRVRPGRRAVGIEGTTARTIGVCLERFLTQEAFWETVVELR